jgi:hypothetical protein
VQTLQLNTRLSNKSWVGRDFTPEGLCADDNLVAWRRRYGRGRSFRRGAYIGPNTVCCCLFRPLQIDEGFAEDDLEANLQRDKYARLTSAVNELIDELTPAAPDFQLRDACDQLVSSSSHSILSTRG